MPEDTEHPIVIITEPTEADRARIAELTRAADEHRRPMPQCATLEELDAVLRRRNRRG